MFKAPKNSSKRKSFAATSTNTSSTREGIVSDSNIDTRRFSVPHPPERFSLTSVPFQNKTPNELVQSKSANNRYSLPAPKSSSRPSPLLSDISPPLSSSASDKSTSSSSSLLSSKRNSINISPPKLTASGLQIGDRVHVESANLSGTLRFLGSTKFKPGIWAGVELDNEGTGKNDGVVDGVRYFSCAPKSGLFILSHKISKLSYSRSYSQCTPISESASEISEDCYVPSKAVKQSSISSTPTDISSKRSSSGFRDQNFTHTFGMSPYQTGFSSPSPNVPIKSLPTSKRFSTVSEQTQLEELGADSFMHRSTLDCDEAFCDMGGGLEANDTRQLHLKLEILRTENEFLKLEAKQTKSNSEFVILKTEIENLRRQKQDWERAKVAKAKQYDLLRPEINALNAQLNGLNLGGSITDSIEHSTDTEVEELLTLMKGVKEALSIKDVVEKELRDHIMRLEASNNGELSSDDLIVSLRAELEERSAQVAKLTARLKSIQTDFDTENQTKSENLELVNRGLNGIPTMGNGKQDIDSLTRKVHQCELTIKSQEKLLRDFKAAGAEAFDHYERTLQSIKNENSSLKLQAENVVNACKQLESDANTLRFELERAQAREEELMKESISLQETVDNYQLSNAKRKEEIQKLRQELQKQSDQILDLAKSRESGLTNSDFDDEKNRLLSQIDELLSSVKSLETEKLNIVKSHQELLDSHATAKSEMANLRVMFEQFDTERQTWSNQQTILHQQIAEFTELIEEKDRELQASKEELNKLNQSLKERDAVIKSLRTKVEELESREGLDAQAQSQGADHAVEITQLKVSLDRLQKDYSSVLEENAKLQDEHVELMEAQEKLLEAHTLMENECLKLMEEVETLHSDNAVLFSPSKTHPDTNEDINCQGPACLSPENQDGLSSLKQRHTAEIREMQKKIMDLELSKQHELDLQAKNMGELEALVEDKVFRETELEEQIIELQQRIVWLEKQLADKCNGSPMPPGNNLEVDDLYDANFLQESKLNSLRDRILSSPVDEEPFCELCEQNGHDILSCTEYTFTSQALNGGDSEDSTYCENCEEFGDHWTHDCPNQDETF
ncbi:hypothetical protein K493DRAFT_42482 [Basidiobolus meristosporus CBS 931.73]|uniref:CAP-Gly domain-containing protein n=1 Tax=Basidiobolus meristosporus CBS 931.73 TaxID=1314790 RepID=A0A1Y1Z4N3_9FUNG|nr:hypothetical protein K493DRAFT_42482 [Basidiobolus meristosporus CBS 931.73]|eukprot:ORY05223.1 hypothetical protein K493DRAFT_42482 [Basidiobolus meristosporus CBS 931.73]